MIGELALYPLALVLNKLWRWLRDETYDGPRYREIGRLKDGTVVTAPIVPVYDDNGGVPTFEGIPHICGWVLDTTSEGYAEALRRLEEDKECGRRRISSRSSTRDTVERYDRARASCDEGEPEPWWAKASDGGDTGSEGSDASDATDTLDL